MAWAQLALPVPVERPYCVAAFPVSVDAGKRYITVETRSGTFTLDTARGMLISLKREGEEQFARPAELMLWRALLDNDKQERDMWLKYHVHKSFFKVKAVEITTGENAYTVTCKGSYGPPSTVPIYFGSITYVFTDAGVSVSMHADMNMQLANAQRDYGDYFDNGTTWKFIPQIKEVPRFGMRFSLRKEFEDLEYFGMGDGESYVDFCHYTKMGLWKTTVTEEYTPYIMPQDHSNHIRTSYATLRDGEKSVTFQGAGSFEFSALHHTVESLFDCQHAFELPEPDSTEVIISYKNRGVGSGSCVVPLMDKYRVTDKTIDFTFHIR